MAQPWWQHIKRTHLFAFGSIVIANLAALAGIEEQQQAVKNRDRSSSISGSLLANLLVIRGIGTPAYQNRIASKRTRVEWAANI